jgi:hypothetical protein
MSGLLLLAAAKVRTWNYLGCSEKELQSTSLHHDAADAALTWLNGAPPWLIILEHLLLLASCF